MSALHNNYSSTLLGFPADAFGDGTMYDGFCTNSSFGEIGIWQLQALSARSMFTDTPPEQSKARPVRKAIREQSRLRETQARAPGVPIGR